nr:hypothetical protein [uncultured Capnocytophaga sp.]
MSFKSYLQFLLKSTNQHGVHSPFVYLFVTQCLYNKQLATKKELIAPTPTLSTKQQLLLLKIIRYFSIKTIFTDDPTLSKLIPPKDHCTLTPHLTTTPLPQLLFINHPTQQATTYLNYMHNDSILIINNIHQEGTNKKLWQQLISSSKVTAHISVYHQGYIFIRKEQPKQAFFIR